MTATKIMQVEQPEPLNDGQGNTFSLVQFIRWLIDTQPAFNSNMPGARSALRIEAAVSQAERDGEAAAKTAAADQGEDVDAEGAASVIAAATRFPIRLEDRDLKKLVAAAEDPQPAQNPMTGQAGPSYPVQPARRLIEFVNALHAATMVTVEDTEDAAQAPN